MHDEAQAMTKGGAYKCDSDGSDLLVQAASHL